MRVVDVEPRLQATQAPRRADEPGERTAQLIGLGQVLRVIDDDVVAARELQRVLDRARLRARLAVRHHEHAHVRGKRRRPQRRLRLAIHALDDEDDLEPRGRIVESRQCLKKMGDDARLAVERHEHRVERHQLHLDAHGRRLGGEICPREEEPKRGRAQRHDEQKRDRHHGKQHGKRRLGRVRCAEANRGRDARERGLLPAPKSRRGRELRRAGGKTPRRLVDPGGLRSLC